MTYCANKRRNALNAMRAQDWLRKPENFKGVKRTVRLAHHLGVSLSTASNLQSDFRANERLIRIASISTDIRLLP